MGNNFCTYLTPLLEVFHLKDLYYRCLKDMFVAFVLQSYVNNIEFDYMEYARQRFQQYWLRKAMLLDSAVTTMT